MTAGVAHRVGGRAPERPADACFVRVRDQPSARVGHRPQHIAWPVVGDELSRTVGAAPRAAEPRRAGVAPASGSGRRRLNAPGSRRLARSTWQAPLGHGNSQNEPLQLLKLPPTLVIPTGASRRIFFSPSLLRRSRLAQWRNPSSICPFATIARQHGLTSQFRSPASASNIPPLAPCVSIPSTPEPMDFSLNDHQKLIRDTVRQFMETEVRPSVKQRDREERFPTAEISKIAALGCCGMTVPEEWGGPGLDTISYVLMLEEVARIDAAMATSLSVTNSAVQLPLLQFRHRRAKEKISPPPGHAEKFSAPSASPSHKPAPTPPPSRRARCRDGAVYQTARHQDLGHQRQRRRHIHRLRENRSRRRREGNHRLPRRAEFPRLQEPDATKKKWASAPRPR